MHDEFMQHASRSFSYSAREQPLTEAELLEGIAEAAAPAAVREPAAAASTCGDASGAQSIEGLGEAGVRDDASHAIQGKAHVDAEVRGHPGVEEEKSQTVQWMSSNPIGVPTEREIHSTQDGGEVYRVLVVRR